MIGRVAEVYDLRGAANTAPLTMRRTNMISTEEGICYSPYPRSAYMRETDGVPWGITSFFDRPEDLQMWNIMWLSLPSLDDYLAEPPDRANWDAISKGLDTFLMGMLLRALYDDEDRGDFGDPPIREMLKLPPLEFMRQLRKRPYRTLSAYIEYGEVWMNTMQKRAQLSEEASGKPISFPEKGEKVSNVVSLRRNV